MIKRIAAVFLLPLCTLFVSCEQGKDKQQEVAEKFEAIGQVSGHKLVYTKHARCRMRCRYVDESEVEEIVSTNNINPDKSQPESKPCPKFAYEGMSHDHQSLRIIIAQCETDWKVVTCIDLGNEFACDCK